MTMKKKKVFNPEKLKVERERKGLTFLTLSRALQKFEPKLSKQSVWVWETGRATPSFKSMNAIASLFGRPIDYFLKSV